MSEPGSGSDVVSMKLKAEKKGTFRFVMSLGQFSAHFDGGFCHCAI